MAAGIFRHLQRITASSRFFDPYVSPSCKSIGMAHPMHLTENGQRTAQPYETVKNDVTCVRKWTQDSHNHIYELFLACNPNYCLETRHSTTPTHHDRFIPSFWRFYLLMKRTQAHALHGPSFIEFFACK